VAADLGGVNAGDVVAALELFGEVAVVSQKNEAFAVEVQAADREDARADLVEEDGKRGAALVVHEHGDHALGLVEREVDLGFGAAQELALDLDGVVGERGLFAELGDLAVDRDEPFGNERLSLAAGADPGLGDDLLDAFGSRHGHILG
jgi:hypothetical protein